MKIKQIYTLSILCLLVMAASARGQLPDTLHPVESITESRDIGDLRVWRFFGKDSTFGSLISEVTEKVSFDGYEGIRIKEILNIDFRKLRGSGVIKEVREFEIANNGIYLGDRITMTTGERSDEFSLKRSGDSLGYFYTRNDKKVSRGIPLSESMFAWDNNYVDQLELFFARRKLAVGEAIIDSIFQPKSLATVPIVGRTYSFDQHELYQGKFDSVFLVHLNEPTQIDAFITRDHRLVKLSFLDLSYRVYLDEVREAESRSASTQITPNKGAKLNFFSFIAMLPYYIALIVITLLSIMLLDITALRSKFGYFAFAAGISLFGVALLLQFPVQRWIVSDIVVPALQDDGSLYIFGLMPPLWVGIIQTLLIFSALTALFARSSFNSIRQYLKTGVMLGGGFGLMESLYNVGYQVQPLISTPLIERSFFIAFHVAIASLISIGIIRNNLPWKLLLSLAAANCLLRYLPVLVKGNVVDVGLMYFIFAFLVLGFVTYALIIIERSKKSQT